MSMQVNGDAKELRFHLSIGPLANELDARHVYGHLVIHGRGSCGVRIPALQPQADLQVLVFRKSAKGSSGP
eukprot:758815-Prorocentrum_lima.AAC.1